MGDFSIVSTGRPRWAVELAVRLMHPVDGSDLVPDRGSWFHLPANADPGKQ